ncbi:MAG TPA: hypothetical protein VFQ72_01120 [Candidatus Paceibacterota bacterium]|nr:hypothetical protein [Candidatus Paceibacterota bacterium]
MEKKNYRMKAEAGTFKLTLNVLRVTHMRPGFKRFLRRVWAGFSLSGDTTKHPEGVILSRVVDRENNKYEELVIDNKTGTVARSVQEPLTEHFSRSKKS